MEEAAHLWRMERQVVDDALDEFAGRWSAIFGTKVSGFVIDIPSDWGDSVERFMSMGMTLDDLERIMKSNLGNLQEDARRIIESEDNDTCLG